MDADAPDDGGVSDARSFLNSISSHPGRVGDTSNLHPQFAVRLANAIKDARAAGLPVGMESGFRDPGTTGSNYDASGMSLHDKGAAADINGLGGAGSPQAQQWAQIAAQNGLYNPYGVNDPKEFNHWQLVPWTLENKPDVQAQISAAGGKQSKIWDAIAPAATPGLAFTQSGPQIDPLDAYAASAVKAPPVDPLDEYLAVRKAVDPQAKPPAPIFGPPMPDPLDEYAAAKGPVAPAIPAVTAGPASAYPSGMKPGSYPFGDPRNFVYGQHINNAPNDTVDPYTPASQQLSTAAKNTMTYVGGQIGSVPAAVADEWNNAAALAKQGGAEYQAGNVLPSFPSRDPRTWEAGGLLKSLAGVSGQVFSPLTGATNALVQQPVTEASGSPEIGMRAGMVANTAASGLLSPALGAAGRGVGNATIGSLDPETAQLAVLARDKYGIPLNAPQLSPSPGMKIAASALGRLPFSGAGPDIAAQQDAWLHGVAHTIGEDATRLTPSVMNAARTRIGSYYDTVAKNTSLRADPKFIQDIHDTLNDASSVIPEDEARPLVKQAQNILQKIDPNTRTISGETYQALTNTGAPLDKLTESDNPNVAHYANGLKTALDGALARSAAPEYQDLLKTADRQWASLKTIQPLAAKAPTGEISPALLAGAVNKQTGNGMAFGRGGDLGELANIGQRFLKEPGSSNTAERALAYSVLAGGGGLGALGGHDLGLFSNIPASAAVTIPAMLAAGRGASSVLRSKWLGNELINRSLNPSTASRLPNAFQLGSAASLGGVNQPVNALAAPNQP